MEWEGQRQGIVQHESTPRVAIVPSGVPDLDGTDLEKDGRGIKGDKGGGRLAWMQNQAELEVELLSFVNDMYGHHRLGREQYLFIYFCRPR